MNIHFTVSSGQIETPGVVIQSYDNVYVIIQTDDNTNCWGKSMLSFRQTTTPIVEENAIILPDDNSKVIIQSDDNA